MNRLYILILFVVFSGGALFGTTLNSTDILTDTVVTRQYPGLINNATKEELKIVLVSQFLYDDYMFHADSNPTDYIGIADRFMRLISDEIIAVTSQTKKQISEKLIETLSSKQFTFDVLNYYTSWGKDNSILTKELLSIVKDFVPGSVYHRVSDIIEFNNKERTVAYHTLVRHLLNLEFKRLNERIYYSDVAEFELVKQYLISQ